LHKLASAVQKLVIHYPVYCNFFDHYCACDFGILMAASVQFLRGYRNALCQEDHPAYIVKVAWWHNG